MKLVTTVLAKDMKIIIPSYDKLSQVDLNILLIILQKKEVDAVCD